VQYFEWILEIYSALPAVSRNWKVVCMYRFVGTAKTSREQLLHSTSRIKVS
jgi:hypothetical protein